MIFKLRGVEYTILFFLISNLQCFLQDFCQKVYEETILFQLIFQKSISRCSIVHICPHLELFFQKCWHFESSWIKYFGNDFSFLIKWHIWVYYCWNYGPSNLKAELKADFWLQIGIYSRKNCSRHGSGQLPLANS